MSSEIKRQKRIAKVIKAMNKMVAELKAEDVTDAEFHQLAVYTNQFIQELYAKRSNRTPASRHTFNEAMETLKRIRRIYQN